MGELLAFVQETGLDIAALAAETCGTLLKLVSNTLNCSISKSHLLVDLIIDLELRVLIHELHPFNEVSVLRNDLSACLCSDLLETCLVLDELMRLFGSGSEGVADSLDLSDHLCGLIEVDVIDALHDVVDQLLALADQTVVEVVALDQEHAHANLIGSLGLDLLDRVKVDLDFLNVLRLYALGVGTEFFHSLRLLEEEEVLVVDID